MKIGLRNESKTILLSLVVLCLMLGSMGVKARPEMSVLLSTPSIKPGETISVYIEFEYENTFQKIEEVRLYYSVNSLNYDHQKLIWLGTYKPENATVTLSTSELDLEDGDYIKIKFVCDWYAVFVEGSFTTGVTVNVYEDKVSNGGSIIGLVFGIVALISMSIIPIVRRRKKG